MSVQLLEVSCIGWLIADVAIWRVAAQTGEVGTRGLLARANSLATSWMELAKGRNRSCMEALLSSDPLLLDQQVFRGQRPGTFLAQVDNLAIWLLTGDAELSTPPSLVGEVASWLVMRGFTHWSMLNGAESHAFHDGGFIAVATSLHCEGGHRGNWQESTFELSWLVIVFVCARPIFELGG